MDADKTKTPRDNEEPSKTEQEPTKPPKSPKLAEPKAARVQEESDDDEDEPSTSTAPAKKRPAFEPGMTKKQKMRRVVKDWKKIMKTVGKNRFKVENYSNNQNGSEKDDKDGQGTSATSK